MDYNINITKFIGSSAVFLSLIPWFSFGLLNTDSVPWPFIAYTLFLLKLNNPLKIPKNFIIFFVVLIFGIFIALLMSNDIFDGNIFRSLYNYLGVVVFFIGFYNYLDKYGFPTSIFVTVNIIWFLFGILELFSPETASMFSTARTGGGRGVTSLAPEATFFGIYLFFSSWLLIVGNNYNLNNGIKFIVFLNLLAIIFLAKASMVILYLVIVAMVFLAFAYLRLIWSKKIMRHTTYMVFFAFIGMAVISQTLQESRFIALLSQIQPGAGLSIIFSLDGSLNHRLEHLVYSIHGSINNFLLPSGFDTFAQLKQIMDPAYNYYFWSDIPSNKIMSWNGDWLYQLGLFGFIFVSYLFYISSDGSRSRKSELILLLIILFSAIPLAFPMISMLFALYTYKRKIEFN